MYKINKLVVAVIVFILLDIIALYFLMPQFIKKTSTNSASIKTTDTRNSARKTLTKTIKVSSRVPNYELILNNKAIIDDELENLQFWQNNKVGENNNGRVVWKSADNLEIIMVDSEQPWGGSYTAKNPQRTSGFDFKVDNNRNAVLTLWVNREIADTDERMIFTLNRLLFSSLYDVTHWEDRLDTSSGYVNYVGTVERKLAENQNQLPLTLRSLNE